MHRKRFVVTVIAIAILAFAFSRGKPIISTGMTMKAAVRAMESRGLEPQKMAYKSPHNAFNLKDGRAVVLIGDKTVTDIQIIANPDQGKANRQIDSVSTLSFVLNDDSPSQNSS